MSYEKKIQMDVSHADHVYPGNHDDSRFLQ